jgi:hypothetical protein
MNLAQIVEADSQVIAVDVDLRDPIDRLPQRRQLGRSATKRLLLRPVASLNGSRVSTAATAGTDPGRSLLGYPADLRSGRLCRCRADGIAPTPDLPAGKGSPCPEPALHDFSERVGAIGGLAGANPTPANRSGPERHRGTPARVLVSGARRAKTHDRRNGLFRSR